MNFEVLYPLPIIELDSDKDNPTMKRRTKLKIEGSGILTYHWKNGRWVFAGKDPLSIWHGNARAALQSRKEHYTYLGHKVEIDHTPL